MAASGGVSILAEYKMRYVSDGDIRACERKKVYRTRIDADLAIAEIWSASQLDLNKYKCPACDSYRLTSRQRWTING